MSDVLDLLGSGKFYLSPIIGRVGGKTKLRNVIVDLIPSDIKIYVEPFIGGASILLSKERYAPLEVINDKDKDIVDILKDIQKVSLSQIEKFNMKSSRELFDYYLNKPREKKAVERLERNLYLSKNSFSGNRKSYANTARIGGTETLFIIKKNLDKYKERLKDVKILNQDYTKVIKKYDSKDTLFYLDPPYSKQEKSWGYKFNLNPIDILKILKTIKGRFIMSYDDNQENREIFKDF